MDYSALLKRAASIVWNHKFLWALGFLAALGGNTLNGGGNSGSSFNFPSSPSTSGPSTPTPGGGGDFEAEMEAFADELARGGDPFSAMPELVAGIASFIFLLVCCLFLFFIVMWFVRQVAEAGMIQSVFNIEAGQSMDFGSAMSVGMDSLWRYVAINVLLKLIPGLIIAVIGGGVAFAIVGAAITESEEAILGALGTMFACLFPLLCIFWVYNIWVTLVYPFAQRGVTLQDLGVMESIKHGWQTLKDNFTPIFLLGILFVALSFVVGIGMLFIYLPILGLTFFPADYLHTSCRRDSGRRLHCGGWVWFLPDHHRQCAGERGFGFVSFYGVHAGVHGVYGYGQAG
ncbi:MAG: hypothetical protein KDD89_12580 [Anaerolineales bacterium]|nr:hypothetical protein [Anaerolineales bacterium]